MKRASSVRRRVKEERSGRGVGYLSVAKRIEEFDGGTEERTGIRLMYERRFLRPNMKGPVFREVQEIPLDPH